MACEHVIMFVILIFYFFSTHGSSAEVHECDRVCDGNVHVCEYDMEVESYSTMSKACYQCPFILEDCERKHCVPGNGFKRLILTVNRQMPGPAIRVCHGDTVVARVHNKMGNFEGLSMHWHGIHQKGSNFMDGVAMISQCPIHPGSTWRYEFTADPPGTHWYHSHTGPQRGDGVFGTLIVKESKETHQSLYDYDLEEHSIILQDWEETPAVVKAVLHEQAKESNRPAYLLINGRGAGYEVAPASWITNSSGPNQIPHGTFKVEQGSRYRFRLISNALLNCPMEVFIEGHKLLAIASDGSAIEPVEVDSISLAGGERWDFVLTANQTVRNYWFHLKGLADCPISQQAILKYKGADENLPPGEQDTSVARDTTPWVSLNPLNDGMIVPSENDTEIILPELTALSDANPDWLRDEPDHKFYIGLDLYWVDNPWTNNKDLYSQESQLNLGGRSVIAQLNHHSGVLPDRPYLSQYNEIPQDKFCTYNSKDPHYIPEDCKENFCSCIHRMKVGVNDVVEMILIDQGKPFNGSNHGMHIHGLYWSVLAMGQVGKREITREEVIALDQNGEIERDFNRPIQKDSIMLPDGGYVVTKFKAQNPGVWLMHCHNDVHSTQGMNMVLEVGEEDDWDLPEDLPVCGSYPLGPRNSVHMNRVSILLILCSMIFSWF